jgi:hypothetical protein
MREYSGRTDPDLVLQEAVSDDEVWSWLEMVLKVGNQRVVGGLSAFEKEHPPNLVSFSSLLLTVVLRASDRVLTLPHFSRARSSPVLPPPLKGGGGRGQAGRLSRGFPS